MVCICCPTKFNPADDPSRAVPLRLPCPLLRAARAPLLRPERTRHAASASRAPSDFRLVLDVFQGAGRLLISLGMTGLGVELGIDAYGAKGRYRESQDLMFAYTHFALQCPTWTVLKCFSNGTRISEKPGGDGSVAAEAEANQLATFVIRCCFAQARKYVIIH